MNDQEDKREGEYQLWAELLALESVSGNPLDPKQEVPIEVVSATMGTLLGVVEVRV